MNLGGQALIEGVLIRSPRYVSISVRKKGKIKNKTYYKEALFEKYKKLLFIRGILALYETLAIAISSLIYSAEEVEGEKISNLELVITFALSIGGVILFFILAPLYVSKLITSNHILFNLIDGILRIIVFVGYVIIIGSFKDVKRTFQYHGAEHMAISCWEARKKLTVENVKKFRTMHERCGTSFIFLVLILSILLFSFITGSFLVKFLARLALIPVIAGASYEVLKLNARYKNKILRILAEPGIWLQKLTTRKPEEDQIEIAIDAVKNILKREKIRNL